MFTIMYVKSIQKYCINNVKINVINFKIDNLIIKIIDNRMFNCYIRVKKFA